MGKDIGEYAQTKNIAQGIIIVVLAFFTVVASSPNLSTFYFRVAKLVQKKHPAK